MITAAPSTTFEAVAQFATGLAGTLGVRITDNAGATTVARVTAGIAEYPAGSGIYAKTLTAPATAGQYTVLWDDGTNFAPDDLIVTANAAAAVSTSNLYVTADELKTTLDLEGTYADDDIDIACAAASRAIDGYTDSRFYPTTETRYYTARCYDTHIVIDDAVSVTSVTVDTDGNGSYDETWVEGTDFYLDPPNAVLVGQPTRRLDLRSQAGRTFPTYARAIKVIGSFGWAETPAQVRQAARILAGRFVKRAAKRRTASRS
jgi:hypothetical protein